MNAAARSAAAHPAAWLVILAGAAILALTMGTRQTMGLFLGDLNTATGVGIASVSLAFAIGQLCWGITQPVAGAIADRYGAAPVLVLGCTMVALGTFVTPWMGGTLGLVVAIGMLAAAGAGMAGPSVLMAAATRMVPESRRGIATSMVNAGGSIGQFVMAPLAGVLIAGLGWMTAMQVLALLVLLALPAAWVLRARPAAPPTGGAWVAGTPAPPLPVRQALRQAWALPSYRLLAAGFFTCGFHVAFLATHLPGVVAQCGLSPTVAAWSLAVLGLFNIAGTVAVGWAMGRWRSKFLLSGLYFVRALAVLLFLAAPKTEVTMLVFAAVMGATFLSTVPPTAALVATFFGPANMAMLFGVVMLTHQIGSFLGAWAGGAVFAWTGSFDWVWYVDVLLALGAALVHLPIREERAPATAVAPAAA
jgi:predicted MFS family arabinose efflux permease